MGGLRFRLLGNLEVVDERGPVDVGTAKVRSILTILLLHTNRIVPTDMLVDRLWDGEAPATATATLHGYLSGLRKALEPEGSDRAGRVLITRSPGYVLELDLGQLDITDFETLNREAHRHAEAERWREASERFTDALALWRGPALGEAADAPFARSTATALEEARLAALDGWARAELALGRHAEVVGRLDAAVAANPLRESLSRYLMLALYRSGRQAEALRAFSALREVLVDGLGIAPGRDLVELESAILAQDRALDWVPPPAPAPAAAAPSNPTVSTGAPAPVPERRAASFIGRRPELAALHSDLGDARAGHGRITSLGGEPGIGKTRLADEVAAEAEAAGDVVVWGRCFEGKGAPAFWPWTQIVEALLARGDPDELRAALGRSTADLAQIVPAVLDLVDTPEPLGPVDPDAARFRVYEAVTSFLRRLSAHRPIVAVLDDVHWADGPSLELLAFLGTHLGAARVLVVTTHRSIDPVVGEALGDALAELGRSPAVRRLVLDGLGRSDVARFVAEAAAAAEVQVIDPSVVATLHERTHGNPFFLSELLRLMASGDARTVPNGVREVIRRRVSALEPDAVDLLRAAAVLGLRHDLAVLADVAGLDAATTLERLEPALAAGLVEPTQGVVGGFRFSHGLVNETLYDELTAIGRARLHLGAAEALQARHGDGDGPHLVVIATHRSRALPLGEPADAVDHLLRAARWSQSALAYEQAEDHLAAALSIVDHLPTGADRSTLELRVQDQLSQLITVVEGYASPRVATAAERMRVLCLEVDDPERLLASLWRLSIYLEVRTEFAAAIEIGHQMLDLVDPDTQPGLALAGHMTLGAAHNHQGDFAEARRHLDAAMAMCEAGHAPAVEGVVMEGAWVWTRVFSAWNRWMTGDADGAEELVLTAVAESKAEDPDGYAASFSMWFSCLIATLRQDVDVVLERTDEALAVARQGGFVMFMPYFMANQGWALAAGGDLDEGRALIEAGRSGVKASGARMLLHVFPAFLADRYLAAGRLEDAVATAEEGLAEVEATGEHWYEAELHRLRGEALWRSGDATEGEAAVRTAIAVASGQGALAIVQRAQATLTALQP
ncbi:MAG TPA: BTAD domain-containing putative transcriptional regulator [Iamia sp.]|nr:BTAD domain-containing putative transcriptional regulator [Iamia sp.]